jgi:hypothetical protein
LQKDARRGAADLSKPEGRLKGGEECPVYTKARFKSRKERARVPGLRWAHLYSARDS